MVYRQISGWTLMSHKTMWEITRWPFHLQYANDKLMLMPWLESLLVFFLTARLFLVSLKKRDTAATLGWQRNPAEKVSRRSFFFGWWLMHLFTTFFFPLQWILEAASVTRRQPIVKQETSGLYFPCHGPWHRLNGSEEEIYRDNRGRQTGRGERSEEERQKKEDRQTWSGDRIKEKGRITVNKKKTPTTTLCQCQVCKKHTAWKPERGESQYALEPWEANSNTTTLGWILQGALWDSLIMGEAKERRWGNE